VEGVDSGYVVVLESYTSGYKYGTRIIMLSSRLLRPMSVISKNQVWLKGFLSFGASTGDCLSDRYGD